MNKREEFAKELQSLLVKYDARISIEDMGGRWAPDDNMVVEFGEWGVEDIDLGKSVYQTSKIEL